MDRNSATFGDRLPFSRPLTLRARMLISFGLLVTVTFLMINLVRTFGVPFTTYSGSYGDHISEAMRNLNIVADLKKDRILLWLEERKGDAEALARNQVIASSLPDLRQKIQESLESGNKGNALRAEVLGQEICQRVFQRLRLVKNTHSVYQKIQLADAGEGLILASTEETEVGDDVLGKPYLSKARTLPDGVWVAIEPGRPNGKTSIVFSVLMYHDGHGNPAVVVMFVDMDAFVQSMLRTGGGLGESGGTMLFNENAQILMPLKHPLGDGTIPKVVETRLDTRAALLAAEGKEGSFIGQDYRGVPVLAATRSLKIMPGVNWGMAVTVDRAEVLGQLWQRFFHSMLLGFACLIAGGVLAVVIAGRISRPIENLSQIAQKVESGDLSARAEAKGSREVGVLSTTFNSMMERVQGWHEELEKQVKARTSDLTVEITRRKQAEADVAQEKERLAVTLRSIGDGVISTDTNGKIVSLNGAAEQFTGWLQREAVGRALPEVFSIINEVTRQPCENPVQKVLKYGHIVGLANHTVLIGRDGTERVLADSGAPIRDENGEIVGVVLVFRDVTEQTRATEELRKREETLKGVLIASPVGILFTQDRRIKWANDAWAKMFGFVRKDEYLDKSTSVMHPSQESYEHGRKILYEHLKPGQVSEADARLKREDGSLFDAHISITLLDPSDPSRGTISAITDISDRKRAEDCLKASEQRLELALWGADLGLWDWNLKTGRAVWNERAVEMLGYSPDEVEADLRTWKSQVHPEDWPKVSEVLNGHLEGRFPLFEVEYRIRCKSGEWRWILGRGKIVGHDMDGKPLRMAGTNQDVTDRKRAQVALEESEQQYRSLFEESRDGVSSVLRDGEITDANESFVDLFGYTRKEMIGKDVRELYVDPADRTIFQEEIEKKGFVKDYEIRLRKKDGTEFDCLLTSSVKFGENGNIAGYRGIIRDVTIRKRLQNQLFQAQKMEAIGTLAGGIAHDFNNLLQVVLGYTDMLIMQKAKESPDLRSLKAVRKAAKDGGELVKGLLTFSRQAESTKVSIDLTQKLQHLGALLRRIILKTIEIDIILADDLTAVNADPIQMEQVLMNLAINAQHAMPKGGKLIVEAQNCTLDKDYCRTNVGAKPGEYVMLKISDTGHGMEKEVLDHIFEPFFTTKETGVGTGLGLSIVYGIVKIHDGHITCSSEPGQGTTFSIYLPAVPEESNPSMVMTKGEMPAFGTEVVLLADDEEPIRNVVAEILRPLGYKVFTAENGHEALEIYREKNDEIDLIVLDLDMPGMGGSEVLDAILKIDRKARVLIASGYSVDESKRKTLEVGASGFIAKPFDARDLLRAVRRVLDETSSPRSRASGSGPVFVRSAESKGTPATAAPLPSEASPPSEAPDIEELPRRLRILAIDDREPYLRLLEAGLRQFGHTALTASSGIQGLQVFQETPVEVVVCDQGMPELDGWEVAQRVKEICRRKEIPKTPFILLTGQADMEDPDQETREKMAECGVDAIVGKPIDIPDLLGVIKGLI